MAADTDLIGPAVDDEEELDPRYPAVRAGAGFGPRTMSLAPILGASGTPQTENLQPPVTSGARFAQPAPPDAGNFAQPPVQSGAPLAPTSSGPNAERDALTGTLAEPDRADYAPPVRHGFFGKLEDFAERSPIGQIGREAWGLPATRQLAGDQRYQQDEAQYNRLIGRGAAEEKAEQDAEDATSKRDLEAAQANAANADAYAKKNPQPKPEKAGDYKLFTVPGSTTPVMAREDDKGNLIQRDGTPLPANAAPYEKPESAKAVTLQLPNGKKAPGKTDGEGNLLLENGHAAPAGTMLFQQPNYGELILPTKTQTRLAPDGTEHIYGWNEDSQGYDKDEGIAPGKATDAAQNAQGDINYAQSYVQSGNFTGAGDEALMESFFDLAKPSSGFRMSQPQINMLMQARSWMDSAAGMAYHAKNGVWFPPDQRQQIVSAMQMKYGAKNAAAIPSGPAAANAGKGDAQPPGPAGKGMKWQHRTVNGQIEWRQVKAQQQ